MRRMWLDRLPELLEILRSDPEAGLWRHDVEQLFGVSKESALQIMRLADVKIIWKPTKALAVQASDILRLLEQIPECPPDAGPLERREWVRKANAIFAQLIANPIKSKAIPDQKLMVPASTAQVQIPLELADLARDAADREGISLDHWVASTIARRVNRGTRSRRQPVQVRPTLFPSEEFLKTTHPKPS